MYIMKRLQIETLNDEISESHLGGHWLALRRRIRKWGGISARAEHHLPWRVARQLKGHQAAGLQHCGLDCSALLPAKSMSRSTAEIPKVSWHPTRLLQRPALRSAGLSRVSVQGRRHSDRLHRCANRTVSIFSGEGQISS